ncbi:hypothetical protein V6O07_06965, partial [Arthrospira platensis SPKY2]
AVQPDRAAPGQPWGVRRADRRWVRDRQPVGDHDQRHSPARPACPGQRALGQPGPRAGSGPPGR